jgi:hypothetical protein
MAEQFYWPEIDKFAVLMRRELNANKHKAHWSELPPAYLFGQLKEHVEKLDAAIQEENAHDILEYGADVANLAMMVVDRNAGLQTECGSKKTLDGKLKAHVTCLLGFGHEGTTHSDGYSTWEDQ